MTKIIMIIILLALVILVHEWGHFIAARLMGVKVNEFAIGMGPKVWGVQKGETLYSIRLLPIGGFCSMEGESEVSNAKDSLLSKRPWQRLVIYVAGAFMNFVLAMIFIFIVVSYVGVGTNVVKSVEQGMPAYEVLQPKDKIITLNGTKITDIQDINAVIGNNEETYLFEIQRGKDIFTTEITLKWMEEEGRSRFGFSCEVTHFNILKNLRNSITTTAIIIKETFKGFTELITGRVATDQIAGIVGVAQISADAWNAGMERSVWAAIINLVHIGGFISANLGVINLLPLPALDGGRILFTLIEIIRGKPLDPEKEGMIHLVGFILIMGLMIFVLYNDVVRIIQ
jgi:regulator of sigma E protease